MSLECPFCAVGIRDHIFMQSNNLMALYNIAPILPGHSMVVPVRHVESIFELSDQETGDFFRFAKQTTDVLMRAFNAEGFDWSLQESVAAGQSVAHLHLHIIPRQTNDLNHPGEWYALLEQQRHATIDNPDRKPLSNDEISAMIRFITTFRSESHA